MCTFRISGSLYNSQCRRKKEIMLILLITIPTWINMLVRTYAWMGILQDDGIINTILGYYRNRPRKNAAHKFCGYTGNGI